MSGIAAGAGARQAARHGEALVILLTGAVGAGKTTVAGRTVELLRQQGRACGGLLAPALLDDGGAKIGIWGVDLLSGERRILARIDRDLGGPGVGPYSFDADALAWSVAAIEQAADSRELVVVDEIGRLELEAGIGLAPILPRLARGEGRTWLVLVRVSLLAELQRRLGSSRQAVIQVDAASRDSLPAHLVAWLSDRAASRLESK